MLLRSASTPIFRSFTEPDLGLLIKPIRSITMSLSSIKKTSSESDLRRNSKFLSTTPSIPTVLVEEEAEEGIDSCFGTIALFVNEECGAIPVVSDGIGGGVGGGGRSCGGGGGGGGGGDDSGRQSESMDSYYQRMIKDYPGDALLLGNYAMFLKEVKGDAVKAEEYCERAILAKPCSDGKVLSMYGDLIWSNHKDGPRAQWYFDQAVKSAPDDSYVLASYAQFLWDYGEEEEEEEEEEELYVNSTKPFTTPPNHWPPLGAAS